jgi:hypothetical protein
MRNMATPELNRVTAVIKSAEKWAALQKQASSG